VEYKSKLGIVHYHDTPWNSKVLKGNSLEIDSIESDSENLIEIITEFCIHKAEQRYVLIASRISASLIDLKKAYFGSGFLTVEHTLDVLIFGLDLEKLSFIANKFPVIVEDYDEIDIVEIEVMAEFGFNHGRFYEDPFIQVDAARNRNRNWIKDLISQNASIKVLKKKNNIVGFMAYIIHDDKANLVLGAVKEDFRHLSYGFWANVLLDLKDVKEIHTLISSSNTDILNLYSYFGFRFKNPQFGFHKHL
jgi:hypothetical protein